MKRVTLPQEPQLLADAISFSPSQEYIRSLRGKLLEPKLSTYAYRKAYLNDVKICHPTDLLNIFKSSNQKQARKHLEALIPQHTKVWVYKQQPNGYFRRLRDPYYGLINITK